MIPNKIIISRTDSIGDVVLTLPLAGFLKSRFPDCELIFLGRNYTRDVVLRSENINKFISWDEVKDAEESQKIDFFKNENADLIIHVFPDREIARSAAKAKIKYRIGSTGRIYHYWYSNKLVPLSRKNSELHEAQLNFKLLKPLIGKVEIPELEEIYKFYNFQNNKAKDEKHLALLDPKKFNIILHPKSKGSAREWPLENYTALVNLLPANRFKIFITGTADEGKLIEVFLEENEKKITDLTGRFTLKELIEFIGMADGLVAASTGPLHLAAALNRLAIGIYPPIRPMHPGRWAPIGPNAHYIVKDKSCDDCKKSVHCQCINDISPLKVFNLIQKNA